MQRVLPGRPVEGRLQLCFVVLLGGRRVSCLCGCLSVLTDLTSVDFLVAARSRAARHRSLSVEISPVTMEPVASGRSGAAIEQQTSLLVQFFPNLPRLRLPMDPAGSDKPARKRHRPNSNTAPGGRRCVLGWQRQQAEAVSVTNPHLFVFCRDELVESDQWHQQQQQQPAAAAAQSDLRQNSAGTSDAAAIAAAAAAGMAADAAAEEAGVFTLRGKGLNLNF